MRSSAARSSSAARIRSPSVDGMFTRAYTNRGSAREPENPARSRIQRPIAPAPCFCTAMMRRRRSQPQGGTPPLHQRFLRDAATRRCARRSSSATCRSRASSRGATSAPRAARRPRSRSPRWASSRRSTASTPTREVAFSSYAVPTILGEIKRHFRDRTWSVRVPRDLQELALKVDRTVGELTRELQPLAVGGRARRAASAQRGGGARGDGGRRRLQRRRRWSRPRGGGEDEPATRWPTRSAATSTATTAPRTGRRSTG